MFSYSSVAVEHRADGDFAHPTDRPTRCPCRTARSCSRERRPAPPWSAQSPSMGVSRPGVAGPRTERYRKGPTVSLSYKSSLCVAQGSKNVPDPGATGLADSNRSEERVESASPETRRSDKSCCSESLISLFLDRSRYNVNRARSYQSPDTEDRPNTRQLCGRLCPPHMGGTHEPRKRTGSPVEAVRRGAISDRGAATQRKSARTRRDRGIRRTTGRRTRRVRCGLHLTSVRTTQNGPKRPRTEEPR